ncbi:hypothetical protein DB88DRAFT_496851 [Papiliotrema laurentii]|uniref:Uncharacterized protein n=1 Tax=Papiliotrema laurentii TaxID=5418 RepID=A0AAD9CUZ9_PAPLA|nr:hypothetical protein DB88DRAFT_496851 [Papiliotrema laurentii]
MGRVGQLLHLPLGVVGHTAPPLTPELDEALLIETIICRVLLDSADNRCPLGAQLRGHEIPSHPLRSRCRKANPLSACTWCQVHEGHRLGQSPYHCSHN